MTPQAVTGVPPGHRHTNIFFLKSCWLKIIPPDASVKYHLTLVYKSNLTLNFFGQSHLTPNFLANPTKHLTGIYTLINAQELRATIK